MGKKSVTLEEESVEFLESAYPDALNTNEALRHALSDARLVREGDVSINQPGD